MKGFIRIVEIIIIALTVFVLIFQLSRINVAEPRTRETQLLLQGGDALSALDRSGVNWFNQEEVDSELASLLPQNVVYNLRLENVLKPGILVGCICSPEEFQEVESALRSPVSFNINSVDMEFTLQRIDPSNIAFPSRFDVIVVGEYSLYSYYDELVRYLAGDKGVVEIRRLKQEDIDFVQEEVFGLEYDSGAVAHSSPVVFPAGQAFPNGTFHSIYQYFHAFPTATGDRYAEPHVFSFPTTSGINISDSRNDRIILEQLTTKVPAAIVKENIVGSAGRTAWITRESTAAFAGEAASREEGRRVIFEPAGDYTPLEDYTPLGERRIYLQECGDGICEEEEICQADCGIPVCGDGICQGIEEIRCPGDCALPPFCGDGTCNGAETCSTCAFDCGACPPVCGDRICNGALETCSSCPPDCGTCPPPFCGDRACNGVETCSTCSIDCGTCEEQPYRCGDGRCTVPETCSSCSQDCGLCSSPDTITDSAPTSGCNGVAEGGTCTISFTYNDASGTAGNINKADGVVELAIGADTSAGKDPTPTFLGLSCTGGAKVAVLSVIYTASGWTPPPNTPPGARIKDDGPLPPVTVNWNLEACAGGAGDWDVADTATSVSLGTFTLNDWASFTIQPAPSGGACGNGTVDVGLGEQCDDGNILPGDGCGPTCLLELACNGNTTCDPGESCNTCIADCGPCIPILPNATELPDDKAVLIKSVVAWAAGDRYDVLAGRVATNPVSARYIKILNRDFYQPMEIILTLGSKF